MTDTEMDRIRQRFQDRLAEISEDMHRLDAKTTERLEQLREAREARSEAASESGSEPEPEPVEVPIASDEDDEIRIERQRRTSALIEQLELARPEGMEDRGVRLRGR